MSSVVMSVQEVEMVRKISIRLVALEIVAFGFWSLWIVGEEKGPALVVIGVIYMNNIIWLLQRQGIRYK